MPGILYHLSFAEVVYRKLILNQIMLDKINFMAGNLIPDFTEDYESGKIKSHYRKKGSLEGCLVPDMELVKRDLCVLNDPIKLGMYAHLYFDYQFIEGFLVPEFIWNVKEDKVINPMNNKEWNKEEFFSYSGLYGAYTETNQLLVKDGRIALDTLKQIPDILPNTGLEVFDKRRKKTWREELDEYLLQKKEYTGEILEYNKLWNFIKGTATSFEKEIEYELA